MENPNMISVGRMAQGENSGDRRKIRQTPVNRKKTMIRLWKYLGRNRVLVCLALVFSASGSLFSLYAPKLSGQAINAINLEAGQVDFNSVFYNAGLMAGCYIASVCLNFLLSAVMVHLSRNVSRQMRHDIFENLTTLPVSYFDTQQAGDIISSLTYDVETVNQSLSSDLLHILQYAITIIGALVMMISIAPSLLTFFIFSIPITTLIANVLVRKVRPLFRRRSISLGELNGFAEEALSGQKTIRVYGREEAVLQEFDRKNQEAVTAYARAEGLGPITGAAMACINSISIACISILGAIQFLRGSLKLGDLGSFIQYSQRFANPINATANIFSDMQSAIAAAERVFRLIDAEPELPDAEDAEVLTDCKGDVVFENVSFSYDPGTPIIEDLTFHAKPGSMTAIVGPTGAGKTTIINLLMRFYDVNSGTIRVDGKDIRHLTRDSLRHAYSMVLQDTWLFHGTIYENIVYGKENATMEDVIRVAKAAHIHSFISRLPDGYNTVLSDNGTSISKGQKQLLTIARAMLVNANMLILDEATSNVDTRTEQNIQAAMHSLMAGKTSFVVAHRLSTIRAADHVLVLDGGKVVEQGNHESLMAQKGMYYKLYQSQFDSIS